MAKKNRLTKSKTLYTIKKRHSTTNNGIIYENDHVTIVPNDGLYDDGMALFSDSNFLYRVDSPKSNKKRHVRGEYIKPEETRIYWTLNDLNSNTSISEESKIVLKPNYSSLRDFAYYGSAIELVKASVTDIIKKTSPDYKVTDEIWETLDNFQKVLLNKDTNPIYKAVFETPYSNDKGHFYENKSYVWPSNNGRLDVESSAFQNYLSSLITLAMYHDGYDSDNIWRMMTHESIKNLDWTYSDNSNSEIDDFDSNGIASMLRIYGRHFDDIKLAIDNIKHSNSISYNGKNNVPDYFLTDKVESDGWVAKHVAQFENTTTDNITYGETNLYFKDKNGGYVNSNFQRRLALSSNYIQSLKGTRRGIEAILGLFGYKEDETLPKMGTYSIDEYTYITKNYLSYDVSSYIRNYVENVSEVYDNYMEGYPVALIESKDAKNEDVMYLVPWYHKNKNYSYPFYFQSKGGWGKRNSKDVKLDITNVTKISQVPIYGETQPYMKFVNNIDEMLSILHTELFVDIICYVTDISDIQYKYERGPDDYVDDFIENCSHYFSLKNIALSSRCGFVLNDLYECYGWKNISINEIENGSSLDAERVIYMETLISKSEGNNPHSGNGNYDDGDEYLENFRELFKGLREDNAFENLEYDYQNGLLDDNIEVKEGYELVRDGRYGFDIEILKDNEKCAYFHDLNKSLFLGKDRNKIDEINVTNWNSKKYVDKINFPDTPSKTNLNVSDESQANGIINVKKIVITFNDNDTKYQKEYRKYLEDVVFNYLEEMIPSTAILEYKFTSDVHNAIAISTYIDNLNSYTRIRAAHVAVDNDNNINVWREDSTLIDK